MIYIALGANLPSRFGTPANTIEHAIHSLNARGVHVIKSSRVWLTAPVPISNQPWFHNAVVCVETSLSPQELLTELLSIESDFGRIRIMQNEARVLDLDIIAYNDQIIEENGLIIPHSRMHERGFVLYPLRDISPDWVHPQLQKSIDEMISQLPADQMARVMDNAA